MCLVQKGRNEPGLVVPAFNLSTWEAEAGGWQVQGYVTRPYLKNQKRSCLKKQNQKQTTTTKR
jgi:hypothetical protein